MITWRYLAVLGLAVTVLACQSGSDTVSCDTTEGSPLASLDRHPWPKFRRDVVNSGRTDTDLNTNPGQTRWVFPATGELGTLSASPIIGTDGTTDVVYLIARGSDGSALLRLYTIDRDGNSSAQVLDPEVSTTLTSTPLLSENGQIVGAFSDGALRRYDSSGKRKSASTLGGFVSGSANIDAEGTVYVASAAGSFASICANGGFRFLIASGGTQSSVGVAEGADPNAIEDDLFVLGADDHRVRAVDFRARQQWVFTAAAAIHASVVIDEANDRVYAADTSGRVYAIRLSTGQPCSDFRFDAGAPITASPAMGPATLYVAAEDGTAYALDLEGLTADTCATGTPSEEVARWRVNVGAAVRSSPSLATGGDMPVLVFGDDAGVVHALADTGTMAEEVWSYRVDDGGAIGRSSPAIGSDGTVYIGSEGGHLYAIGSPAPPTRIPTVTAPPTATPTPTPT